MSCLEKLTSLLLLTHETTQQLLDALGLLLPGALILTTSISTAGSLLHLIVERALLLLELAQVLNGTIKRFRIPTLHTLEFGTTALRIESPLLLLDSE